jgi:hypothetical protein
MEIDIKQRRALQQPIGEILLKAPSKNCCASLNV